MNRTGPGFPQASGWRMLVVTVLLTAVVLMTTGLGCEDVPYTSATFRDAALSEINSGVKSIVNGILDGIFAVLQEAGHGDDTSA